MDEGQVEYIAFFMFQTVVKEIKNTREQNNVQVVKII